MTAATEKPRRRAAHLRLRAISGSAKRTAPSVTMKTVAERSFVNATAKQPSAWPEPPTTPPTSSGQKVSVERAAPSVKTTEADWYAAGQPSWIGTCASSSRGRQRVTHPHSCDCGLCHTAALRGFSSTVAKETEQFASEIQHRDSKVPNGACFQAPCGPLPSQ